MIIALVIRGGSRAAATSKMECFVIIAALDPPLVIIILTRLVLNSTKWVVPRNI